VDVPHIIVQGDTAVPLYSTASKLPLAQIRSSVLTNEVTDLRNGDLEKLTVAQHVKFPALHADPQFIAVIT
jgi:hypothetical protein